MSYYNNLLSLPICILFATAHHEQLAVLMFLGNASVPQYVSVSCSCTLGFLLSVSAFQLNRMITPTSLTVLNNTNKFVLIFFTAFLMDYATLTSRSVAGMVCVMIAAAYYSICGKR